MNNKKIYICTDWSVAFPSASLAIQFLIKQGIADELRNNYIRDYLSELNPDEVPYSLNEYAKHFLCDQLAHNDCDFISVKDFCNSIEEWEEYYERR